MPSLDATLRELLAHPREAGTPTAEDARRLVTAYLIGLGFRVDRQRFQFYPSSLSALPIFGAGLGGLALLLIPLLISPKAPGWTALLLVTGGLGALAATATGIGLGWLQLGDEPREDANLIATRGGEPAHRWIVAHLDSKAQLQSMAGRLVTIWVLAVAVATLLGISAGRLGGPLPLPLAAAGAGLALAGGALASRGRLRGQSAGARDNGTGVAAALAAAEALAAREDDGATGILVTGAEEFGLVGARVFAAAYAARLVGVEVVNCDTIDSEGELAVVSHDRLGSRLAEQERHRLAPLGFGVRLRHLPMGILTDSVPFARRGIAAITVGRLTWRTLRTIHTPRDTAEGLSLESAIAVGRRLA